MTLLTWLGIAFCISQYAMFSGLNLAFFSVSRLRLEIEAAKDNRQAKRILSLREDSNFLLSTILWGNVGVNVLLVMLSNSVLTGLTAFLFSTLLITFGGEIMPQAYFSRHALRMASLLSPVIRFYQFILFPVAKLTALILDKWLGAEAIEYFKEKDFRELIKIHAGSEESNINRMEGRGALNFLAIDDLPVTAEGEVIDPESIVTLEFEGDRPVFPAVSPSSADEFLKQIHLSEKKWVIIVDSEGEPRIALNSDSFLRSTLFNTEPFNPYVHCHHPIIVKSGKTRLGEIITRLKVHPLRTGDDEDLILYWDDEKRIITGADILGRLLRGIVQNRDVYFERLVPRED
ncbi:MAG TPA: DUF21 domain-containing protein [bacterium]|nr:DUF21 domain-containing protein [bacterium]